MGERSENKHAKIQQRFSSKCPSVPVVFVVSSLLGIAVFIDFMGISAMLNCLDMVGVTGSIPVAPTIIILRAKFFFEDSNSGLSEVTWIQQEFSGKQRTMPCS
ncbi:MAG TPA: hypothetical protein VH678_14755 [Xanthobacteraceae bacterium]